MPTFPRLGAGSEKLGRQGLREFNPRLVERVHTVELTGQNGRDLAKHERRPQRLFVERVELKGERRSTDAAEGLSGRAKLDVQEPTQGMPGNPPERRSFEMKPRNRQVVSSPADPGKEHDLVIRPVHEELKKRVLVHRTERGDGRRSDARARGLEAAACSRALPERLGPELLEPECSGAESVRVGHEDVNGPSHVPVGGMKEGREDSGRVLDQFVPKTSVGHRGSPGEEPVDLDAHRGRREETHWGQYGEPPPDVRRDGKGGNLHGVGQTPKIAPFGIGREEEVPPDGLFPDSGPQPFLDDLELGNGLDRATTLADDVEECATQVQAIQKGRGRVRVGVVQKVQTRKVIARLVVEFVPVPTEEPLGKCASSEGRSPDSDHDELFEPLCERVCDLDHLPRERGVGRKVEEAELSPVAPLPETEKRRREALLQVAPEASGVEAPAGTEAVLEKISVFEGRQLHVAAPGRSIVSPSQAGRTRSGSRSSSSRWDDRWVRWVR